MGNCESVNEQEIHAPRQGPVSCIKITSYVWSRKYLGLYDYEAQEVQQRQYRGEGNALVIKEKEQLILMDERMDKLARGLDEQMKNAVFRLIRNDNYYQLVPISYEEKEGIIQRPVWLVVRSLPRKEYSVKERDILKLGKQKMRVREVVPADHNQSVLIPNSSIQLSKSIYDELHQRDEEGREEKEEKEGKEGGREGHQGRELVVESSKTIGLESEKGEESICRICLEEGLTSNPLITACLCMGSVRYIHLLCLKRWLSKQIKAVVNDFSVTINWKPLCCEMCKAHYKYRIYLDNQKFYTVDIPKPQKPYLVLEIMRKKHHSEGKVFKFITFAHKDSINLGRKKDVDVRISEDISVSRVHATLKYRPDSQEFILEDNKSKFGTLVLAKNGLNLRPHHVGISVQIGAEKYEFEPLREATLTRAPNYEMGEQYMREELSEVSEDDDSNGSEEDDEVPGLALDDNDRSPTLQRSPVQPMRRSQSLQPEHSHFG